jgi:hypothetical protein
MGYTSNDGEVWGYEEERDSRNDWIEALNREPEIQEPDTNDPNQFPACGDDM